MQEKRQLFSLKSEINSTGNQMLIFKSTRYFTRDALGVWAHILNEFGTKLMQVRHHACPPPAGVGGGSFFFQLYNALFNLINYVVDVSKHLIVVIAQQLEADTFEIFLSPDIPFSYFFPLMREPVYLNYEHKFLTHKVRDVVKDRPLPPELVAPHLPSAENKFPQASFRFGHSFPVLVGKGLEIPVIMQEIVKPLVHGRTK